MRVVGFNIKALYFWKTGVGTFYIVFDGQRHHPIFENESLGSYSQAWQAAEGLAGGHTFSLASGDDTAELGIPEDVSEWNKVGT